MTPDLYATGIPVDQAEPERPGDPRPAWERIAYTWLEREVDGGRPVTAAQLASQTSVAPAFAGDLLQVLRAEHQRDPALTQLRGRLVRDQLTDLYVSRELRGGQQLDPAATAAELGTTATVARQWLHALREVRARDPRLASLRATPEDHGQVHADQLAALAERFRAGGPASQPQGSDRPVPANAFTDRIELAFRRQQATGQPIDPAELARQLGTSRHYVTNTLTALEAGAPTMRQCIEQAYRERELEGGRWVNLTDLAAELGTSKAYVQRVISPLRATHRHQQRTPATAGADVAPEAGRGWLDLAACKDSDPELFFPQRGEKAKGQAAKQVCAACQVQQQCRELAVRTASSRGEDHGIYGATTPHERSGLRGNPTPGPSSWYQDRAAAEEAHRLAVQVGPVAAAEQLSTATSTLARAFARWGLDYPGRPRASQFARDPDKAKEAFALAERLGSVKAAARELGSSRPALVAGWRRFGLGMPDTSHPTVTRPGTRPGGRAESEGRLDPVFVKLNQNVLPVRAGSEAERFWRVRRAEEYATLGAAAVTELHSESRSARPTARVWAITRRAQRAQTLATQRATRTQRRHDGRAQRDHPGHHRRTPPEREVGAGAR
jgi:WhiB family transcriptional regulator, redox-sensing transcriptional regulator